jgi:hypothetical protein
MISESIGDLPPCGQKCENCEKMPTFDNADFWQFSQLNYHLIFSGFGIIGKVPTIYHLQVIDDQIKQIEEELNEQRVDEVMAEITAQGLTIDQALEKLRS